MAHADPDGAVQPLGAQGRRLLCGAFHQSSAAITREIGRREDPQRRRHAEMQDREAAERRPDRAAQVVGDAIGRDRAGQVRLRHETPAGSTARPASFSDQAALSRKVVRSSRTGVARSKLTSAGEDRDQRRDAALTATISRRGSTMSAIAPAGRVKRNIGRLVAACSKRHAERIEVERGHEPARRGVVHRDADQRRRAREPDRREGRMGEGAEPRRWRSCGSEEASPDPSMRLLLFPGAES